MLDLTEPTTHGPGLVAVETSNACRRPSISIGITKRRARSVGLDIAHGRRVDVGHRMRLGDGLGLTGGVGRRVVHLRRSVVVDRRSSDDGVNAVPVVDGGLQRFEDHNTDAAAEDRAVRPHIERPAMADRRHHRSGFVPVPDVVRDPNRGTAGQCHVAFTVQDALAGQVNGDQRRRARRLNRERGAAQIELVRYPGGQMVLVVLQRQVDHVEGGSLPNDHVRIVVRHEVVEQIPTGGACSVHPDRTVDLRWVVAGVFECMPRTLQEQPVLRIHHARGLRRETEEVSVEFVYSIDERRTPHISVVCQRLFADTGGDEFVLRQVDDRLLAATQIVPERRHRIGTGESAGHADDRNRVGRQ